MKMRSKSDHLFYQYIDSIYASLSSIKEELLILQGLHDGSSFAVRSLTNAHIYYDKELRLVSEQEAVIFDDLDDAKELYNQIEGQNKLIVPFEHPRLNRRSCQELQSEMNRQTEKNSSIKQDYDEHYIKSAEEILEYIHTLSTITVDKEDI